MKAGRLLIVIVLSSLLGTCSKEKISLAWDERSLPIPVDCKDILFNDPLHGFALGGNIWGTSYFAETNDGGITWQADSISPWHPYAMSLLPSGQTYVSSFGGYMNARSAPEMPFIAHNIPYWIPWNDIDFWDEDHGILVGGQAYQGGKIIRLNANNEVVQTDSFFQEISGVAWSSATTVHAVGYGIILRSTDGGLHWNVSDVQGDFYRSVVFPTPETGYIVGASGSILKTTDGGENWKKIRNGKSLTTSDLRFFSVSFVSEQKGYIVGEKGLFWRTIDGGMHWQAVEDFPETDLYAVCALEEGGWIAGRGGKIYYFEDK